MTFQKGQSGNPAGKKKGTVNRCTKAKDDYFRIWEKLFGYKGTLKYIKENRQLWPQFLFKVIPDQFPKQTKIEGSGTTVVLLKAEDIHKDPKSGLGEDA